MCVCSALISSTPDLFFRPKPQPCPDWLRNKQPPVRSVIGPFKSIQILSGLIVSSRSFISGLSGQLDEALGARRASGATRVHTGVWARRPLPAAVLTPLCPAWIPFFYF